PCQTTQNQTETHASAPADTPESTDPAPSPQAAPVSRVPAQDLDTDPPGGADASPETRNPPPAEQAPAAPVALFELAPQPKPAARPDLADAVLAEMRAAVRLVTGKPGGPRDTPGNRKLIRTTTKREGATLEDWQHVIAAQVA